MKRRLCLAAAIVAITGATATLIWAHSTNMKKPASASTSKIDYLIAGAGRVEPNSENIKLGSELNGKLTRVYVEEGSAIHRGQILAELDNGDYRAEVDSAAADVAQKRAELRKVINGSRTQERREASSSVAEAEAVMNHARLEKDRYRKLFEAGVVSREEADNYAKEYDVAKAKLDEMSHHFDLVDADAREEDQAMAEANLKLAQAKLDEARALLEKTYIRSPIDGTVLSRYHEPGEWATPGMRLLTVQNIKDIWAYIYVPQPEVSKLKPGMTVEVELPK